MEKKLIKKGTGWGLGLDKIILELLKVNPEIDLVKYTIKNDALVITKSKNETSK